MELDIYVVDAFTDTQFKGNSAAVVPLQEWLDKTLQRKTTSLKPRLLKQSERINMKYAGFHHLQKSTFVDTQRSPLPWCCSTNSALQEVLSFTH